MNILYSTNCPKCQVLAKKLDMANIKYTVNNNVQEMLDKGLTMTPYLEVNGELLDFKMAIQWLEENKNC